MIAVFILKGGEWVMLGNVQVDTPSMRNQLKREAAAVRETLGVDAKVFVKQ